MCWVPQITHIKYIYSLFPKGKVNPQAAQATHKCRLNKRALQYKYEKVCENELCLCKTKPVSMPKRTGIVNYVFTKCSEINTFIDVDVLECIGLCTFFSLIFII